MATRAAAKGAGKATEARALVGSTATLPAVGTAATTVTHRADRATITPVIAGKGSRTGALGPATVVALLRSLPYVVQAAPGGRA